MCVSQQRAPSNESKTFLSDSYFKLKQQKKLFAPNNSLKPLLFKAKEYNHLTTSKL